MSELAAIFDQINAAARREYQPNLVQIRVTNDALKGSITEVPMHPDRARRFLTPRQRQDGSIDWFTDKACPREILMHPEDWARLKTQTTPIWPRSESAGQSVLGIPVVVE